MGTFLGHILPGTFFFIYGLLYIVKDAFNLSLNSKKVPKPSSLPQKKLSSALETDHGNTEQTGVDESVPKFLLQNGESTNNGLESNDYESETEETCLFSRGTDEMFSPSISDHELEARDDDLRNDSLEWHDRAIHAEDQPKVPCKCASVNEWLTNILVLEGILKIVCSAIGAIGELWWGGWYMVSPRTGNFTNMNNWQHATMFTYFAVSGVSDIFFQTCLKSSTSHRHREKIFLSLAFSVEGLLFFFHTHGRDEIDVHIHTLLVIAIFVCAVGSGLDPWCYSDSTTGVRRLWVTATCVQGTWFWQIAFVLYNPWRDQTNYDVTADDVMINMMMMTTMFTWHILAVLAITGFVHLIIVPNLDAAGIKGIL